MNYPVDVSNITLSTSRLTLRPFAESDWDDFFAYASVPGVGEAAGWPHHKSKEDSKKILDLFMNGKKTFALVEGSRVIGSLGIEKYSESSFPEFGPYSGREIGYVLAKDRWGNGLMSEALREVVRYCFEFLGMDFLLIAYGDFNEGSAGVARKAGFLHYRRFASHEYPTLGACQGWYCLLWNPRCPVPKEIEEPWAATPSPLGK
ncbi:MAG: GNAT family N-acetyltransferase [Candidatus Enteromonas sp.]|nr:GNAT family N-acetyltransferase [Candidatus Enteromonas sp.]